MTHTGNQPDQPTVTRTVRLRRFASALSGALISETRLSVKLREPFPTLRRFARTVRRVWLTSDPGWWEKAFGSVTPPSPEESAERAERKRRREEQRMRLAERPAVY